MKTKTLKIDNFGRITYRKVPAVGEKVAFDGRIEHLVDKSFKGIPSGTFCEVTGHTQETRGQISLVVRNPVDGLAYTVEIHKLHFTILKAMEPRKIYLKHKFGDRL